MKLFKKSEWCVLDHAIDQSCGLRCGALVKVLHTNLINVYAPATEVLLDGVWEAGNFTSTALKYWFPVRSTVLKY
jgi:hypothetical protein